MSESERVVGEKAEGGVVLDAELSRRLLDVLTRGAPPAKVSYEEFLASADEDTLAEWVDGEVVMTSPASGKHQDISGFLYGVMSAYSMARGLGRVRLAPFQMRLAHSGREPDIIFVATEHLERLKDTYLDGPADLAIEVLSAESAGRDRGDKFYEYEEAGIPEYWLIDPLREQAEFYTLDEGGHYRLGMGGAAGTYRSVSLEGFWLKAEWLWQDPLPSPLHALAEITGMDPGIADAFERGLKKP